MPATVLPRRKPPRTPPGCEGHLTRQQAADLLGFCSEFKIRQLEREGRLRSVRGPMQTAFYPKADVLAVKAELDQESLGQGGNDDWTDAELLVLLRHPTRDNRFRTALDLVLETNISIDRAEKVCAFWTHSKSGATTIPETPKATILLQASDEVPKTSVPPLGSSAAVSNTFVVPNPTRAFPKAAVAPFQADVSQRSCVDRADISPLPKATTQPRAVDAPCSATGKSDNTIAAPTDERRGEERLSRDALIAELRHPDPRVRKNAFARLKEQSGD